MSDRFHWAERVSRRDIRRLYESDAQGMLDMQGVPRMPVGQNVIQGTTEQVRELIETLAYGPGNAQGLSSPEDWRAVYYDPVRLFKQVYSHSEVQKIAAQLGIPGRERMPEDALIPEILRRAPELAMTSDDRECRQ